MTVYASAATTRSFPNETQGQKLEKDKNIMKLSGQRRINYTAVKKPTCRHFLRRVPSGCRHLSIVDRLILLQTIWTHHRKQKATIMTSPTRSTIWVKRKNVSGCYSTCNTRIKRRFHQFFNVTERMPTGKRRIFILRDIILKQNNGSKGNTESLVRTDSKSLDLRKSKSLNQDSFRAKTSSCPMTREAEYFCFFCFRVERRGSMMKLTQLSIAYNYCNFTERRPRL